MSLETTVSDVMIKDFALANPEMSIYDAENIFKRNRVQRLAIETEGEFIGVLNLECCKEYRKDLEQKIKSDLAVSLWLKNHKVREIMKTNLVVLSPNATLKEVAGILQSIMFDAIFIVKDGKLLGLLRREKLLECKHIHMAV